MISRVVTRLEGMTGLGIKAPVKAVAQSNLTLNGLLVVDGYQTQDGDRVIATNQTIGIDNGIYIASQKAWLRAPDWNQDRDVVSGTLILDVIRRVGWMAEFDGDYLIGITVPRFTVMYGDVTISAGGEANFNPGYFPTFISSTSFSIDGVDVSKMYYVTRRMRFEDNLGNATFGVIATSVFGGPDTTITMTMEGSDVVPAIITAAIFTTSDTQWSPIPVNNHPFIAMTAAQLLSGRIGADDWWVIVGLAGFIATSNDLGATWTKRTPSGGLTTENINDVSYDSDNQRFMAVADDTYIITSLDGINWVSSQPSDLTGAITSGSGNLQRIAYGNTDSQSLPGFALFGSFSSASNSEVYTTVDNGANWTSEGLIANTAQLRVFEYTPHILGRYFFNHVDAMSSVLPGPTWSSTNEDSGATGVNDITWLDTPDNAIEVNAQGNVRSSDQHGQAQWFDRVDDTTGIFGASDMLCCAFSVLQQRAIMGGKDGKMGFTEDAATFFLIGNGFNPTAEILDIWYDENDAIWIAISNDGNICRSTTGIS